jgi:hypothetical protein
METEGTGSELEIKNGKFFILENRSDEKNIKRFTYIDIKPALIRIKELISTVNADKILLSTVDISTKTWNLTGVSWSVIAMGMIRGDISKDLLEGVLDTSSENVNKQQDNSGQKKR